LEKKEEKRPERKFITTADGSHTLYVPSLDEHYHSVHGAIQESMHVFIRAGLEEILKKQEKDLRIIEIGFGTGLNALLTFLEVSGMEIQVHYTTLEAYPLEEKIFTQLNYESLLPQASGQHVLSQMQLTAWEIPVRLSANFSLLKRCIKLEDFVPEDTYDLIYFDAFAPEVQPELWTESIFQKLFDCLSPGGMLLTYCAKGQVRRNMMAAGFRAERLPGPPGKRQMLRATKPAYNQI
jgi:tRNA U34 5-methylaminomethyl-2-thiouridine-forming methyltransferase MnmC